MSIRLTTKVTGASDVTRNLKRFPERIQRSASSILRQEGRGLAVSLARVTVPFSFDQRAKASVEKGISRDMAVTYTTPSKVFAKLEQKDPRAAERFWKQAKARRYDRARDVLSQSGIAWSNLPMGHIDEGLHKYSKNPSGPKQIVTSDAKLRLAIARRHKMAGFAKGGWANAGKSLGGRLRGAAQWVTRHKTAPGSARLISTGNEPQVRLTNGVSYVEAVTLSAGIAIALRVARNKLRLALLNSLNRTTRSANSRSRGA
jgi:hypothetical protein